MSPTYRPRLPLLASLTSCAAAIVCLSSMSGAFLAKGPAHAAPPAMLDASPSPAKNARFALVIGWNQSDDAELEPLRYADDDAIRYHELFAAMTTQSILLTTPDEETEDLVPDFATLGAKVPTRQNVLDAIQTLRGAMARAKALGQRPILYFVYSGHGNYDAEGRGYVHLADGRFSTRDLFSYVIEPTRADPVVLLVDACNAALLVNGRGRPTALAERRPAGRSKLDLADYPNVGVVLASSQLGETHEWGRYLAGVFSHEVRSGLLGAADLDDDQKIGFAELAAFVASANARVKNPTVKITPYIRPPLTDPNIALVDLSAVRFRARLRIDDTIQGKAHILDQDLVRYADFHRTPDAPPFWLALTRPGELILVTEDTEWVVPETATGDIAMSQIVKRPRTSASARGPGSEYFERTLFHEPFDKVFADRYLSIDYLKNLELQRYIEAPWYDNATAWVVVGSGLALAAGGLGMQLRALDLEDKAHATPWADERRRINDELDTFGIGSLVLYGIGGAAVLSGIFLFALDQPLGIETWRPPISVDLSTQSIQLRTDW